MFIFELISDSAEKRLEQSQKINIATALKEAHQEELRSEEPYALLRKQANLTRAERNPCAGIYLNSFQCQTCKAEVGGSAMTALSPAVGELLRVLRADDQQGRPVDRPGGQDLGVLQDGDYPRLQLCALLRGAHATRDRLSPQV